MPRKPRVDIPGFHHVINRGVNRENIFLSDEDKKEFLQIVDVAREIYHLTIHSFSILDNHYHLLIETHRDNLSLAVRYINSQYAIYFNKKMQRIGPLWQGRFKSWYVYDEKYLKSLVKYIEFNPIKVNIVINTGKFKWAMSSKVNDLECLNYDLIDKIDLKKTLSIEEEQEIDDLFNTKLVIVNNLVIPKVKVKLEIHFENKKREVAIARAIEDGYKQKEIADYLQISSIAISKSYKIYRQKVGLFNKLRDKGIFWSYSKEITYEKAGERLLIEYVYKYGDFNDISLGFKLFGKRVMKQIWEEKLVSDQRFIKLNFMIARVFFGMDIEASYFKEVKNTRFEKFKMLASQY